MRMLVLLTILAGCGGLAWNTTVADHPEVRAAMLASVEPGRTTEMRFRTQWGNPTQKIREGAQVAYIYRNMTNPPDYLLPQFGDSSMYVVVLFQYGVAVAAYSSDLEGCRATFAPRPPGAEYPNPTTVKPVNCGVGPSANAGREKSLLQIVREFGESQSPGGGTSASIPDPASLYPRVPADTYDPSSGGKYR